MDNVWERWNVTEYLRSVCMRFETVLVVNTEGVVQAFWVSDHWGLMWIYHNARSLRPLRL